MLKGFGITLGAALLASLGIQDLKGVMDAIAPSMPRVDAEQSTAEETDIGHLTDHHSLPTSPIAQRATQATVNYTADAPIAATAINLQPLG
jgi:hypothetical protein